MIKAIERTTGTIYKAQRIEGGYAIFTLKGEEYKKLKESTFKKYFKPTGETAETKTTESQSEAHEELSPEKREKMLAKIRKILALAKENPSMEEGLSAALQAQKLMVKYNIHEDEVTLEEIKDEISSVFSEQKHDSGLHKWRKQLALIIARNFRCKCYTHGQDVVFRGYTQDAKIALDVYLNLYTIGDKLGSKAYHDALLKTGSGKGVYNSFVFGFLTGIEEGLGEQSTALMVIVPQEVEDEFAQFSANFRKGHSSAVRITDAEAYEQGKNEGKAVVKARAIKNKKGDK